MSAIAPPVQTRTRIPFEQPKIIRQKRRRSIVHWLTELKTRVPDESVSFLTSLAFHVMLLLILALITTRFDAGLRPLLLLNYESSASIESLDPISFESSSPAADTLDSNAKERVELVDLSVPNPNPSLVDVTSSVSTIDWSPKSWVPSEQISHIGVSAKSNASIASSLFASSSLEGRSPGQRNRLAMQNGASKESEAAVDAALVWFAAHQAVDGSWSTEMTDKPCNGQCRHGTVEIGAPKRIAATGLALLCFLGAGHTHKQGDYRDVVYKAINYLTNAIKSSAPNARDFRPHGRFLDDKAQYEMYEHGIAVLAMCEAYEMTGDSILRTPCEAGIDFIQRSQHADGSWGYRPSSSGDLSIVGWQMMALKSARKIGLPIRAEVIHRMDKFLDSQQSDSGAYYGYRSTQREPCTTAIGLMLRLYRGWSRTDPRILKGTKYIADLGPSIDGIYYNYYATQLLFHMKYEKWSEWNVTNRDYLVREQANEGHEKGSWYFGRSHFNQVGGRLYCTAMATLTLEVYYRFMPIYSEIEPDSFDL